MAALYAQHLSFRAMEVHHIRISLNSSNVARCAKLRFTIWPAWYNAMLPGFSNFFVDVLREFTLPVLSYFTGKT